MALTLLRYCFSRWRNVAVTITNRGRGYLTPPRARVVQPIGAQVLDVTVANGSVTNINLLTGGTGYTDAPSVYIVDDRKGSLGESIGGTKEAAATVFNSVTADINIINFGTVTLQLNLPCSHRRTLGSTGILRRWIWRSNWI